MISSIPQHEYFTEQMLVVVKKDLLAKVRKLMLTHSSVLIQKLKLQQPISIKQPFLLLFITFFLVPLPVAF